MKTYRIVIGSHSATVEAYNLVTALYKAKNLLKPTQDEKISVTILC